VAVSTPDQHLRCLLILALTLLAGACVESGWTVCADGRMCGPDRVCDLVHGTCSSPNEECLGQIDRTECAGGALICLAGKCVGSCGDGVLDGPDECEGEDLDGSSCAELGFYTGDLVCRADCSFDSSSCSGACMDGQLDDEFELCDPTDFDPTSGSTCVSQGLDAGRQGCANDCQGYSNATCMRFGWTVEDPVVDDVEVDVMADIWGTREDLFVLVAPGGVRSGAQSWVPVGGDRGDAIRGRALFASSSSDIWVIDETGGGFLHWDGASWTEVASPAGGLNEIWGSSSSNVFAVGDQGAVVHFDGARWQTQRTPASGRALHAIVGLGENEVYAVGDAGTLLRHDGKTWSALDSGTTDALQGVWAHSSGEIWTVSDTDVRRFDGEEWAPMFTFERPSQQGSWIGGNGPSDVWVSGGGDGAVRRYDGTRWSALLDGDFFAQPLWVDGSAVTVGYQYGGGGLGVVRRWYGAGNGPVLDPNGLWSDVWALDPDVWIAVGTDPVTNEGLVLHSDGSRFTFDEPLLHVTGFSADHAFAAGGERILMWDGTSWTDSFPGGGSSIVDLWASGSTDVHAIDNTFAFPARVLHYDGRSWNELPFLEAQCGTSFARPERIWASGPQDVFVAGSNLLARFDGKTWSYENGETCTEVFESIWGSGPGDVWVFQTPRDDGQSRLYHWDGTEWASQVTNELGGPLVGTAADDVFLGTRAHYDGRVWSPINSSTVVGAPVFALPSRLFMIEGGNEGLGLNQFIRTRFWSQRAAEASCSDGVDDDADGATDRDDDDCKAALRGGR
jgi:hypothetical protein